MDYKADKAVQRTRLDTATTNLRKAKVLRGNQYLEFIDNGIERRRWQLVIVTDTDGLRQHERIGSANTRAELESAIDVLYDLSWATQATN